MSKPPRGTRVRLSYQSAGWMKSAEGLLSDWQIHMARRIEVAYFAVRNPVSWLGVQCSRVAVSAHVAPRRVEGVVQSRQIPSQAVCRTGRGQRDTCCTGPRLSDEVLRGLAQPAQHHQGVLARGVATAGHARDRGGTDRMVSALCVEVVRLLPHPPPNSTPPRSAAGQEHRRAPGCRSPEGLPSEPSEDHPEPTPRTHSIRHE
jgi:hypothetical protein